MEDPIEQLKAAQRRNRGVQDLHALEAVVPFRDSDKAATATKLSPVPNSKVSQTELPQFRKRVQQRLTVIPARKAPSTASPLGPQVSWQLPATKRSYGALIGFFLCVVLPVLIASVYYAFFASNQYVTDFRFTVRDVASTAMPPAAAGLMSMLSPGGASSAGNDNYLVADYLTSRQVVDELQERIKVVNLYSRPDIDWWSRFNPAKPIEKFVDYWQKMVTARFDLVTGIASAEIRAFSPQDAMLIANTMVSLSEELINKIDGRSQNDAVRFAKQDLEEAQERLKRARVEVAQYRNKFGIIDPTTSVAASNSTLVQQLRGNLAQLETQLTTLQSQNLSPNAPGIVALKNQIGSTKEQLERTEAEVGKGRNGVALSKVVGEFEQLNLEVQFAQAMVTSTMATLEAARAKAAAQHLYITPYVRPALPQSSTYPNRPLAVLIVAALAFAFWISGLMIVRSIRERFG